MRKRAQWLLVGALVGVGTVVACSDDNDDGAATTVPPVEAGLAPFDAAPSDGAALDAGLHTDDQVLAVMAVANQGEIDQGMVAQTKATNADVKMFADMMVMDHSAALQRGQALAQMLALTPAPNAVSVQLKSEGDATLAQLQTLSGAAFDQQYVTAQVAVHTKVLGLIDTVLMPAAHAEVLRTELTNMRATVAMHLSDAMALQAEVSGDAGAGDAGADADAADGD